MNSLVQNYNSESEDEIQDLTDIINTTPKISDASSETRKRKVFTINVDNSGLAKVSKEVLSDFDVKKQKKTSLFSNLPAPKNTSSSLASSASLLLQPVIKKPLEEVSLPSKGLTSLINNEDSVDISFFTMATSQFTSSSSDFLSEAPVGPQLGPQLPEPEVETYMTYDYSQYQSFESSEPNQHEDVDLQGQILYPDVDHNMLMKLAGKRAMEESGPLNIKEIKREDLLDDSFEFEELRNASKERDQTRMVMAVIFGNRLKYGFNIDLGNATKYWSEAKA
ncbi:hypothetical protein HK096_000123 [Nowakowskiella sp. JEL0078]|nr:hypothetical protein HK096_000123 [Nowakowskiella sp. JEL0078]